LAVLSSPSMTGKRYRFSGDLLANLGKNHKSNKQ